MRRSKRTNTLVLVSDQTKIYRDCWKGTVLHYTGMGLLGEQNFDYMQNKTLYNSNVNGVVVHLFEVFEPKKHTYQGIVELVETPYLDQQKDQDGQERIVCIFPLRLVELGNSRDGSLC